MVVEWIPGGGPTIVSDDCPDSAFGVKFSCLAGLVIKKARPFGRALFTADVLIESGLPAAI